MGVGTMTPPSGGRPDPYLTPDDLCFVHEEGVWGEVRDAAKCTRGEAIAAYASEYGCDFTEVRCVVRYVWIFDRQEVWEGPGRDREADRLIAVAREKGDHLTLSEAYEQTPLQVPDRWQPDESMACWTTVRRDHPKAQKAWMCECKGDDRIPNPPEANRV